MNNEIRELRKDEMDLVSGGAVEVRELVIKAVVASTNSRAPTPLPVIKIRF